MISVGIVKPENLTREELILLLRYTQKCWKPLPVEDLIYRVRQGVACIYRISGEVSGLFVLAFSDGDFYIETVAGAGVVRHFDQVFEKIKETARAAGARELFGYVARPALEKLYRQHTTAQPVATLWKESLK